MTEARVRRVPGEAGIWLFILGDITMFGLMFGTLLWLRGKNPGSYHEAQGHLHQGVGALATVLLVTSSLLVALAVRAVRAGDTRGAPLRFGGAIACAAVFAGLKVFEYVSLSTTGHAPGTQDFFFYFFAFTGIHLLHVTIGVTVLLVLTRLARRPGLSERDVSLVESGASYWHMVDLLWLVLFALLYLGH